MSKFVVYLHRIKENNDVFYVGIGSESRAYSKYSRNKHWKNIVSKHDYFVDITHKLLCREEACSIEKYLIQFYRNHSNYKLCNVTNGGDGADTKTSLILNKKRWSDPKQKENLIKRNKLRFTNIQEREKISNRNIKRFSNVEERIKISETNKLRFSNIEAKENNKIKMLEYWDSEKGKIQKQKLSISLKKYWVLKKSKNINK